MREAFNLFYCACAIVSTRDDLAAILAFADSMIFAMAFANLIGSTSSRPSCVRTSTSTGRACVPARDGGRREPAATTRSPRRLLRGGISGRVSGLRLREALAVPTRRTVTATMDKATASDASSCPIHFDPTRFEATAYTGGP
ncbi:MAG: hypothetical protein R3E53_17660 [Myxococcota bacterium]